MNYYKGLLYSNDSYNNNNNNNNINYKKRMHVFSHQELQVPFKRQGFFFVQENMCFLGCTINIQILYRRVY